MAKDQLETESNLDLSGVEELTADEIASLNEDGNDSEEEEETTEETGTDEESGEEENDTEDEEEDSDEEEKDKPEQYVPGTHLRSLLEENKLPFNEEELPENFTVDQEMQLINELNTKLRTQLKQNVEDANTLSKIYKEDKEVQEFLKARAEGKTMKDYVQELASTPQYSDADALVMKHLQEVALFSEEDAQNELQRLKDNGKFEDRKETVIKYYEKLEADQKAQRQKEEDAQVQAAKDAKDKMDAQYADFLAKTNKVGEFTFNKKIREDLFDYATLEDQDGLNGLERDLQSDDNVLKASLAIKYWDQVEAALKNASKNEANQGLLDRITTDDPSTLQSSSTRKSKQSKDVDIAAVDQF